MPGSASANPATLATRAANQGMQAASWLATMLFVGIGWLLFFYPLDRAIHMASELFVR